MAQAWCDDDRTHGWHFYCDPEFNQPPPKPEPAPAEQKPPAPAPLTATEQMMAYRKHADELKHRAILDPTPENVEAYMRANRDIVLKAGAFSSEWQRVLWDNPDLDANTKRPLNQLGVGIVDELKSRAEIAMLQQVSMQEGVLFVFANPETCPLCQAQAQILDQMRSQFGIAILPVSADGTALAEFPDAAPDQGQLEGLGLKDHPKPLVALVNPAGNDVTLLGAGLLAADQILTRVYTLRTPDPEGPPQ